MKQLKRRLAMLFLLAAMMIFPALSASAASKPANVTGLKSKNTSETSAVLTWKRVAKATGYAVYRVNAETGKQTKIAVTKDTRYTLENLRPNTTYLYQTRAFIKKNNKILVSERYSKTAKVRTAIKVPSAPSNLKANSPDSSTIQLTWKKGKNVTGYYIYLYNESTKKYEQIASTKNTSYKVTKVKSDVLQKYAVRSYRSVRGEVALSKGIKVSCTALSRKALAKQVHGRYFNATLRRTVTVTTSTGKKTLRGGTRLKATSRAKGTATLVLNDGRRVKVKASNVRYGSLYYQKDAYSRRVMEAYVNEKGFTSNTRYLIWISQYSLTVNIFRGSKGHWSLIRTMPCIIGRDGKTPVGTFRLRFKSSAYGGVVIYFTWNSRTGQGNSFHRRVDGNTRGALSHGCVRLGDGDLNYLNRTCPLGTTVISY